MYDPAAAAQLLDDPACDFAWVPIAALHEWGRNPKYLTPLGSVPIRAPRAFNAGRKLTRTHQEVLVFVKGSAQAATAALGDVTVELPPELAAQGAD